MPEPVDLVVVPGMDHHIAAAEAMQEGLAACGVPAAILSYTGASVAAAVVCCWGWRLGAALRATGRDVLVMEHGFIGDRRYWTSLGWNGLNNHAQFPRCRDFARFELNFGEDFRSWRPIHTGSGRYVLLIGQVEGDAALDGVDFHAWAQQAVHDAHAAFDLPVMFRPHPLAIGYGQPTTLAGAQTLQGTLADALAGAGVVVTFNSNTAVEALLAGKPTLAFDSGSIAWPIAGTKVWRMPVESPGRWEWAARLAWSQFTWDEIRSGFAWQCASEVLGGDHGRESGGHR